VSVTAHNATQAEAAASWRTWMSSGGAAASIWAEVGRLPVRLTPPQVLAMQVLVDNAGDQHCGCNRWRPRSARPPTTNGQRSWVA
jgi:hypothetical protein